MPPALITTHYVPTLSTSCIMGATLQMRPPCKTCFVDQYPLTLNIDNNLGSMGQQLSLVSRVSLLDKDNARIPTQDMRSYYPTELRSHQCSTR